MQKLPNRKSVRLRGGDGQTQRRVLSLKLYGDPRLTLSLLRGKAVLEYLT